MKCSLIFYVKLIQKNVFIRPTNLIILIYFYFDTKTSTIYPYCNKKYYICKKIIFHGRIKGKRDNKPKGHISS